MDWARILKDEARCTDVILADELARKYGLSSTSLWKALSRQKERGLVDQVTHKVYVNKLAPDFSPHDFVSVLRPSSYVSLESALHYWGTSTQTPLALTCVTTGKPREYRNASFAITFRSISPRLFWGFIEKQTRYAEYKIAEPEKALLDWVYLSLQEGLTPALEEVDFKTIKKQRLVAYAEKYPLSVSKRLLRPLAMETFAA